MAVFSKPEYSAPDSSSRKKEIPKGLATKCPACGEVLLNKELEGNLMVCKACDHHMPLSAHQRIQSLVDQGTWSEFDINLAAIDVLKFKGATSYEDRLATYQKKTGLKDAVVAGTGQMDGQDVSIAVMDFGFLGGTMGSVVGEKITRAIERGTQKGFPVIAICASGGARMHEGMFSLMQMAKTSAALARHAEAKLPFISVLTNPTMAGVMASYATLGDLIVAEPRAMVGFAGARVIKETTQQDLPSGFQTAEFLLDRGLIDKVIHRAQMRETLSKLLRYLGGAKVASDPSRNGAS